MIKIYIDAGHNPAGTPNSGAVSNGVYEGDVNYRVAKELAELLDADGRFETRLSRPEETTVLGTSNSSSLAARVNDANAWGADYFISIHSNIGATSAASGTEAYVYGNGSKAYALAEDILTGISDTVGSANRGVFVRPSLYVLRKTKMPAVLVELGYLSNSEEAINLRDNASLYAKGIYNGILSYFGYNE